MSEFGLVIFDLMGTVKRREFIAASMREKGFEKEATDQERVAAQYRKAIEILRGKP